MLETAEQEQPRSMAAFARTTSCERCKYQLAGAERELCAFSLAFEGMFGRDAALEAAECWVDLVETAGPSVILDTKFWRETSIMAASRMADRYDLCGQNANAVGRS